MGHGLGTLHQRISLGKTIKVLDFAHFVICLRDPWVSLQPKFQSQIFYGYQDIAVWKVDKMQTQILQTEILNGHNFWLAENPVLQLLIQWGWKTTSILVDYGPCSRVFKWRHIFLFIFWKKNLLTNTYQKSVGDMLFLSLKIKFKHDTLFLLIFP